VKQQTSKGQWSVERAQEWWRRQAWPVGCNFIPSTAVNQLQMWQAETFEPEIIEREIGWAENLGFNTLRVYLHDLAWEQDSEGLLRRVESFLEIARRKGCGVILVIFDDVWSPDAQPGPQPEPVPGRHNSRWLQSPGLGVLGRYSDDARVRERLRCYVEGLMSAFSEDETVLVWDLYNEPGGYPSPKSEPVGTACLPLLRDVFEWARDVGPRQPLTSGLWWNPVRPNDPGIEAVQLEGSDIVSFHHYGGVEDLARLHSEISARTDRPLICTEYLARQLNSRFESHLPYFRDHEIGAISWGLVSGRTQTICPWWSWFEEAPTPEPELWFHDILRTDGSPFDAAEVDFLRAILRAR